MSKTLIIRTEDGRELTVEEARDMLIQDVSINDQEQTITLCVREQANRE